jgi:hypothetical protein
MIRIIFSISLFLISYLVHAQGFKIGSINGQYGRTEDNYNNIDYDGIMSMTLTPGTLPDRSNWVQRRDEYDRQYIGDRVGLSISLIPKNRLGETIDWQEWRIGFQLEIDREAMINIYDPVIGPGTGFDSDNTLGYCVIGNEIAFNTAYLFKTPELLNRMSFMAGPYLNVGKTFNDLLIVFGNQNLGVTESRQSIKSSTYLRGGVMAGFNLDITKRFTIESFYQGGLGRQFSEGNEPNKIDLSHSINFGLKYNFGK